MLSSVSSRIGRRGRLALVLAALAAASLGALLASPLALAAIALAAAAALWDRTALDRELRALAATVAADGPAAKLEVTDGAWGELCHALNRLHQQRQARRQIEPMLPALPVARAARLADAGIPSEGLPCEVAVLALGRPESRGAGPARLCETAQAALRQAQAHEALLSREGDEILLIFGAVDARSPASGLQAARAAAAELHALWSAADAPPRLSLAAGSARAVVLPGLGLTVVGGPVKQALGLLRHAPQARLLCNEDAYLGLRRIGAVPPQPAAMQPDALDQRPVYAVSL